MDLRRRFGGSLLGALLTIAGWQLLSAKDLGARLLIAFVGFACGHLLVRGLAGAPPTPSASPEAQATTSAPSKLSPSKTGTGLRIAVVVVAVVAIIAGLEKWMEARAVGPKTTKGTPKP